MNWNPYFIHNMNNAVIVGLGMVGNATAHAFNIKKYIDIRDIDGFKKVDYKEAADNRYIFICLPTPVDTSGEYFTDDIIKVVKAIAAFGKQNVFIIRSTVYPGFAKHLMSQINHHGVVSNPEFLTEKTWKKDSEHPDLVVIGAEQPNYINDVEGIYKSRYRGVDIIKTDSTTAEYIKLAINGFYSTKVVYANQVYDYAQECGANYSAIKEAMYKRKWIGKNHLSVFHQGGRGAGGGCLSKDLKALANYSGKPLVEEVEKLNDIYLKKSDKK